MKKILIGATIGLALLATACSNDETDYKETAQAFIESDEVEDEVATAMGVADFTFSNTVCTEPPSTDVGSTFTCTSTGSDGVSYVFDVVINAKDSFEIVAVNPAG